MNLLIGPDSVESQLKLYKAFSEVRVKQAKKEISSDINIFYPLLGAKQLLKKLNKNEIKLLTQPQTDYYRDPSVYRVKTSIFNSYGGRELFFPEQKDTALIEFEELQKFLPEIDLAKRILKDSLPWMGTIFDQVISDVWFLKRQGETRYLGGGGSNYSTLGLFTMSLRPKSEVSTVELAISLAHELGHNCFYLLQAGEIPIKRNSWDQWLYSGVRKVERPAYASYHAAVALSFMLEATKGLAKNPDVIQSSAIHDFLIGKEREYEGDLKRGLDALKTLKLTETGKIGYMEMVSCLT